MTCGIYQIKNKTNGKSYIGSSINIEGRCKGHLRGNGSIVVKSAVKKYGKENFEILILEKCTKDMLIEKEQYFMDILLPEYNMSSIAGRIEMTPEVRAKIGVAHIGNKNMLGYIPSKETRAKMSAARIGNTNCLGYKHSKETRAKMSKAGMGNTRAKGYKHSAETRAKVGAAERGNKKRLGYIVTEATRQKLREAWVIRRAKLNINQI